MSDSSKNCGLVPRGAPVKPPLFKMPRKMHMVENEADRAHGGGVAVTGTRMDNYGSYYQAKQKVEKFDSGLDEVTQRWNVDAAITPVSCTEDERGISEYLYQPRAKTIELSVVPQTRSQVESHLDISDSAVHDLSASFSDTKKLKVEDSEVKIDSKILRTVHQLFVEDEDGER